MGTPITKETGEMILLVVLLLVGGAHGAQKKRSTVHVTTNYARGTDGWITLDLHQDTVRGKIPVITRIDWCKSILPNPSSSESPMPPDINNCNGRGLLHLQLYPGPHPLVRTLVEEPHRVYVDPINVGGWDTMHQADIILHATVDDETELVQVVRFNPIYDVAPTTLAPQPTLHVVVSSTEKETEKPTPKPEELTPVATTKEPAVVISNEGNKESVHKYSWEGMAAIFGAGAFIMLVLGLIQYARVSNWSVSRLRRFALQRGLPFLSASSDGFEFLEGTGEDDDVVELDDMRQEHLEILKQLGSGASPAFSQNLEK